MPEQHSTLPEGVDPEQLIVRIGVVKDRPGGCTVSVESLPESPLVAKYGGVAAALTACRDFIIGDLDFMIAELTADKI
jgi:hypothetical protein